MPAFPLIVLRSLRCLRSLRSLVGGFVNFSFRGLMSAKGRRQGSSSVCFVEYIKTPAACGPKAADFGVHFMQAVYDVLSLFVNHSPARIRVFKG